MKKSLLSLLFITSVAFAFSQTTHQVCVSEVSNAPCSNNNGIFTPANLNIAVGDNIQFTTYFMGISGGYDGSNHQIRFNGSSPQDVILPISSSILNQVTTVTTPAFNTPGVYSMECVNSAHCFNFAQTLEGWACTGYSVTVGSPTQIAEYQRSQTVNVYPNPTSDLIHVNLLPVVEDHPTVYLIDLLGKVIESRTNITSSNIQFNVSGLEKGSYLIKIVSNKETFSYPVIVQ